MLYALVVFVLVAPGIWLPHPEFLTFNTLEKCEEAVTSLTIDNVWKGLSDGLLQVKCFEYDNTQSRDQFILDINQLTFSFGIIGDMIDMTMTIIS